MAIPSSAIKRHVVHILYMFIMRIRKNTSIYDIGIVDDNYLYYEHQISILSESITPTVKSRIDKLFNKYLIDKNTEIDILKGIDKIEPLYMYLSIVNLHAFANLRLCDPDVIPRRICAYHPTYIKRKLLKNINKTTYKNLWNKLLQYEKCPWINYDIDMKLNNMSEAAKYRGKFMRISLYYLVVKRFLVDHVLELRAKNKQKSKLV